MKIGRIAFAAMFAIGLGSSCAHAQTATFTAVVADVDTSAGIISLSQALPAKPAAVGDAPTVTADYVASPLLLGTATVGATVQATVQLVNGKPAVVGLRTPKGTFFAIPQVAPATIGTSTATLSSSLASNPVVSNPARLTPSGM